MSAANSNPANGEAVGEVLRFISDIVLAAAVVAAITGFGAWLGLWDVKLGHLRDQLVLGFAVSAVAAAISRYGSEFGNAVVYCGVVVATGFTAGVALRNLVLEGCVSPMAIAVSTLGFVFVAIAIWLWNRTATPPFYWKSFVDKKIAASLSALAATAAATMTLAPFFAGEWNELVAGFTFARIVEDGTVAGDSGGVLDRIASLESLLTIFGVTVATTFVAIVAPGLDRVLDVMKLSGAQTKAAQRLRATLSDLLKGAKPIREEFKREVVITRTSFERELPLESIERGGAYIKLMAPPAGIDHPTFDFPKIKRLLDRASVDVRQSLFFIYADEAKHTNDPAKSEPPLCYATGAEMWDLMQAAGEGNMIARFRGAHAKSFFGALNSGNGAVLQSVVAHIRAEVLAAYPQDDLLLASRTVRDTDKVSDALAVMDRDGLRRVLVVSNQKPAERAIFDLPRLSRYIWDPSSA